MEAHNGPGQILYPPTGGPDKVRLKDPWISYTWWIFDGKGGSGSSRRDVLTSTAVYREEHVFFLFPVKARVPRSPPVTDVRETVEAKTFPIVCFCCFSFSGQLPYLLRQKREGIRIPFPGDSPI